MRVERLRDTVLKRIHLKERKAESRRAFSSGLQWWWPCSALTAVYLSRPFFQENGASNVNIMTILKVFCFCFTPKTGSLVLGSVGVILSILMIVPPCLILESHDFYFNEYIRQQKSYGGVDIRDEDIPGIKLFNKVSLSSFVAYLVIFTFASILMISGVAARRSFLLIPWLVVSFLTLLFFLIMSISAMFAIANIKALVVLFPAGTSTQQFLKHHATSLFATFAGVPLGFGIYFWIAVYSTFLGLRNEETAKMVRAAIRPDGVNANTTGNSTANMTSNTSSEEIAVVNSSAETEETEVCSTQRPSIPISHSSPTFMHFKDNSSQRGQRAGSPPPPYEVSTKKTDRF